MIIIVDDEYLVKCINGENPELQKGVIIDSIFDSFEAKKIYEIKIGDESVLALHNEKSDNMPSFKTIEGFTRELCYEISSLEAALKEDEECYSFEEQLNILTDLRQKVLEYKDECLDKGNNRKK